MPARYNKLLAFPTTGTQILAKFCLIVGAGINPGNPPVIGGQYEIIVGDAALNVGFNYLDREGFEVELHTLGAPTSSEEAYFVKTGLQRKVLAAQTQWVGAVVNGAVVSTFLQVIEADSLEELRGFI